VLRDELGAMKAFFATSLGVDMSGVNPETLIDISALQDVLAEMGMTGE